MGPSSPNNKGKQSDEIPEASTSRPALKKKKGRQGKREVLEAGLVAAVDRKNPRGPGLFDDMLKKPCPYHQGPVKHTLEECTMLRRYYAKLGLPNDDVKRRGADDKGNDKDDGFLEVHNVFMIFGGPSACLTTRQRKKERREVFSVKVATP